jgi:hypothetical protein
LKLKPMRGNGYSLPGGDLAQAVLASSVDTRRQRDGVSRRVLLDSPPTEIHLSVVRGRTSQPVITATVVVLASLLVAAGYPILAVDKIPETSGFGGYFLVVPGVFDVSSNMIYSGAPLLDDVANNPIESIFEPPSSQSSAAVPLAGEVNYTFSGTRTQLFFGNRLEDVLRLDVSFGLGVRQELPDKSVMALSVLGTPLDLKLWSDPYVEGENRVKTDLDQPGVRFRWGQMFKTGLEFTAQYRQYEFDEERSGDWLVTEGRLNPASVPLLNRNGNIWRAQFRYRIRTGERHVFEPTLRYTNWDLDGAAVAHAGPSLQLTYLYITPKLVVDLNLLYHVHESDTVHPVYDTVLEADRYAVAVTVFYDLFKAKRWRAIGNADFARENTNIAFFDSKVIALTVGAIWRHGRK